MNVIEQRGVFWWHDEVIPDGLLVPDSYVAGVLRIEASGRAFLELDGYLSNPHGPMAAMTSQAVTRCIQGLLKGDGERILLCELIRDGGQFSSHGISFERFRAVHCLIGRTVFASGIGAPLFNSQTIPLSGFEEWLRLGAINVEQTNEAITASYQTRNDIVYSGRDGSLSLIFNIDVDRAKGFGTYAYSLKQVAYARLSLNTPITLNDLAAQFRTFEDLLKLLTGSDFELAWPSLTLSDGSRYRWYFQRMRSQKAVEPPSHYNTVTVFPELRDEFGAIWTRWKAMREEFGPALYLYFGTRRGMPMYVEHRFVNLVWGLEALHRKKQRGVQSETVAKKVNRILNKIDDAKDKRWLAKRLENAFEPTLEQRLFEIFEALPLGFDKTKLRSFCQACAKLRNDISHFGGERHEVSYSGFVTHLNKKSEALSVLYHTLLLHAAGVDAEILKRWVFESFDSYPIKSHFVEAGLLDPSVLDANQ
jgi:hypothetical protein